MALKIKNDRSAGLASGTTTALPLPSAVWPDWVQSIAQKTTPASVASEPPALPAVSLKLADLFADPHKFTIPLYQRLYSWTVREAGQLLEDVASAAGVGGDDCGEPDYFLSSIVLLSLPSDKGEDINSVFEIVDGQQRLVTVSLLAAVLRSLEDDPLSEVSQRLHTLVMASHRRGDGTVAVGAGGMRLELRGRDHSYYERLVRSSFDRSELPPADPVNVSERNLQQAFEHFMSEVGQLEPAERRQLGHYICDRCHMVVIFTRERDRAYRLFTTLNERGRPLQRNDLLKAEVLHNVAPERVRAVAVGWDHAAEMLGTEFENLFGHIRTLHGKKKTQIVAGVRSIIAAVGGAEAFIEDELRPLAEAFYRILHADDPFLRVDPDVRGHLVALRRLNGADWIPSALLVLKQYGNDVTTAQKLMREIERFAYLLRVLCLGTGKRQTRFAAVAESIKTGRALEPNAAAFRLSRDELRTIEFNLRDFHRRNAAMCKLLLLRVNDALSGDPTALEPSALSVEHILPLRPSATSEWRRSFPDAEEREACTESLGNLLLVSPRQNDRARNQDFARKQAVYRMLDEGAAMLDITRDVLEAKAWTPVEIRARESKVLGILSKIWA